MKSVKTVLKFTTVTAVMGFFLMAGMNSITINKQAFLKNDLNIKFAKRLDDMTGEVIVGRMAASLPKWGAKDSIAPKKIITPKKSFNKRAIKIANTIKASKAPIVSKPLPAIKENLPSLVLTGGLYNQKPLEAGMSFSGSAKVINGVIEGLDVTLPDGKSFSINMNDRMVGNVFQYEDSNTRELKSGLFYRVKKGQYMMTLTDDTKFSGMRLEFKTAQAMTEDKVNTKQAASWAMNNQNPQDNPKLDVNNYEDDSWEAAEVDRFKADYADQQDRDAYDAEIKAEEDEFKQEQQAKNDIESETQNEDFREEYNEDSEDSLFESNDPEYLEQVTYAHKF